MSKRYSDQLGEWIKKKQSRKRDKNLVAFLAVKADVQEALGEGYAVKTIWEHMFENQRIEFGYDTFLNYTNRLIRRGNDLVITANAKTEQQPTPKKKESAKQQPQPTTTKPQQSGFIFDSSPKKEDYL